jgi:hypothetical protein
MMSGSREGDVKSARERGHFAPLEEPERFRNAVFGFLGLVSGGS